MRAVRALPRTDEAQRDISLRKILTGVAETFRYPAVLLRGSLIGAGIGASLHVNKLERERDAKSGAFVDPALQRNLPIHERH